MKLILEVDLTNETTEVADDVLSAIRTLTMGLFESIPPNAQLAKGFESVLQRKGKNQLVLAEMAEPTDKDGPPPGNVENTTLIARFKVVNEEFDSHTQADADERKTAELRDGLGNRIEPNTTTLEA